MNELGEALKGFTDLPIALIAAVFAVLLRGGRGKTGWSAFFLLLSATAFLGAAAHILYLPPIGKDLLWVVLYLGLFETVRRVALLLTVKITGAEVRESSAVYLIEVLLYAGTLVTMFWLDRYDILIFAAFALYRLAAVVVCCIKTRRVPKQIRILLCFLFPPLLLQILAGVIPYAVVIEHLFLIAALCVVFGIAKKSSQSI